MKPITVRELIIALNACDPNAIVSIATDSEGNSYSNIPDKESIMQGVYIKDELGTQEFYFECHEVEGHDDKSVADFYGNLHKKSELKKAVILWPSN